MAFLKTSHLFMRQLYKTEVIFNKVMKENIPISKAVDKYLEKIRTENVYLNKKNAPELLEFPYQTFSKLNQKYLKNIITETYNMLKEKGFSKDPNVIIKLLRCYSDKRVDVDMETVLKEITDNEVAFDENICNWIIMHYSTRGEMKAVEILLNEMKSKGIDCYRKEKCCIVSGYIIAGQPEQAENFIKENKLNMESHDMFYSRCFGYASIGDVASLKNVLAEMKERNINFTARRYCNLYERLVYGNVDSSDLTEIIDLTKSHLGDFSSKLFSLIAILNAADHFNYSLIILENLSDLIDSHLGFIELFATPKCPVNTFKQVLTLLVNRCRNISFRKSIFFDLEFDSAFDICQKFSKTENWKVIYYSLLNKAVSAKSLPFIEKALNFSFMNLQWWQINLMIQQSFLPLMQITGMVSNYEEILDLLPAFKNQILPVILMKYLCSGDFSRFNELLSKQKSKQFSITLHVNYLASDIVYNLGLKEIKKWSVEAAKCFDEKLINNTTIAIFINEVIKFSNNESSNDIEELIDYAKEWNIELTQAKIDFLSKFNPEIAELIRSSIGVKNDVIVQDSTAS